MGLKQKNNLFSLVVLIMSTLIHCELLQIWKKFNIKTKNVYIYIYIKKIARSQGLQLVLSLNMKALLHCTAITSLGADE